MAFTLIKVKGHHKMKNLYIFKYNFELSLVFFLVLENQNKVS